MEISSKAIDGIREVRLDYERQQKVFDRPFFDEIFSILRQEEMLKDKLKVMYDAKGWGLTAYVIEDEIHIVLKNLVKDCLIRAEQWMSQFDDMRIVEVQNLYGIYAVFHELTHIWQTYGCNRDEEINRLYYDLFAKTQNLTFYQTFMYSRHALNFCFERNAMLEAFREVTRVYEGSEYREVAEASYMMSIDDYGAGKNANPVDYTLKILKMKNDYDFSNLTNIEKLEHGIIVDKNTMRKAGDISIKYSREMIEFDEAREKLLKL